MLFVFLHFGNELFWFYLQYKCMKVKNEKNMLNDPISKCVNALICEVIITPDEGSVR